VAVSIPAKPPASTAAGQAPCGGRRGTSGWDCWTWRAWRWPWSSSWVRW
jgi:hypothetical protein